MAHSGTVVCVSGAAGFIANHIVKGLLDEGYFVRGTRKVQPILNLAKGTPGQIELVEADLNKPEGWAKAVAGAQYVLHTASPLPTSVPNDPNELIQPAVNGVLNVLKACAAEKSVEKVVLTGSIAAICGGRCTDKSVVYSESDWTDVSGTETIGAYEQSKTFAEKAAWKFMKTLKEDDHTFQLVVINPGYVIGPMFHSNECASAEIFKRLLTRGLPMVPRLSFPTVDVRDVAKAHIRAMREPNANGKRFVVTARTMWIKEIADVLANEFQSQGYRVPTTVAPSFLVKLQGIFDRSVRLIVHDLDTERNMNNSQMKGVLGVTPRTNLEQSVVDMAYSMIENGIVLKTAKYKLSTAVSLK